MTPEELRETLKIRKSRIDDPDFHPRPQPIGEIVFCILTGALIALLVVICAGYLLI